MRRFLSLTLLLGAFLLVGTSCSKNSPLGCGNNFIWTNEVQNELTALSNAAAAYGADPTPANCDAYKRAYQNYIDALQEVDNCVPASERDAWRDALNQAEDDLDSLC